MSAIRLKRAVNVREMFRFFSNSSNKMEYKNSYLLVMTSCIDPHAGHESIIRSDPLVRLKDYKEALRFWLHYPDRRIDKILFIDNSGYSLSELKNIVTNENTSNKEVEFISLNCNWYPKSVSYGYAEMHMLDVGLEQSKLRNTVSHIIKVTGRLKFPQLTRLLNHIVTDFDIVADARLWQTPFRKYKKSFVCTQIILFSYSFYMKYISNTYKEMCRSDYWVETFLFKKLFYLYQNDNGKIKRIYMRFPCSVDPIGNPAHRLRSYTSFSQLVVNFIRSTLRKVAPFWWI